MRPHCTQLLLPLVYEEWRAVPGFEGWYQVSSLGRLRRLACGPNTYVGRFLAENVGSAGYRLAHLQRPGRWMQTGVHRLVAFAFLPTAGPGQVQVNHIDGERTNNMVHNLEWVTPSENRRHAVSLRRERGGR
jgi:hypothetical protein